MKRLHGCRYYVWGCDSAAFKSMLPQNATNRKFHSVLFSRFFRLCLQVYGNLVIPFRAASFLVGGRTGVVPIKETLHMDGSGTKISDRIVPPTPPMMAFLYKSVSPRQESFISAPLTLSKRGFNFFEFFNSVRVLSQRQDTREQVQQACLH